MVDHRRALPRALSGVKVKGTDAESAALSELFPLADVQGTLDLSTLPPLQPPCDQGRLEVYWSGDQISAKLRLQNGYGHSCAGYATPVQFTP